LTAGITLVAAGNIFASVPGSVAINNGGIVLNTTGGNIAGSVTGGTPLLLRSGSQFGLNLSFSAIQANGIGGVVNVSDPANETMTIGGISSSTASLSIALSAVGSIVTGSGLTLSSPIISLTSTSANIGSTASAPVLVSSNPTVAGTVSLTISANQ